MRNLRGLRTIAAVQRWAGQLEGWLWSSWRQARLRFGSASSVRPGRSPIDSRGLFAQRDFAAGTEVGALALGRAGRQGRHTLQVGSEHRLVKRPWRFINHACRPSAQLRITPPAAVLIASRDIQAGQELTIDYATLPETPSVAFECRCPNCSSA